MELIFCYNAEKGKLNSFLDFIHKTVSPKTYSCNLCAITHNFKKTKKWDSFIQNFHLKIKFYYKSDLEKYSLTNFKHQLPCCLIKKKDNYRILIDKNAMNSLKDDAQLIEMIETKIN